jgi:hypothetical protein
VVAVTAGFLGVAWFEVYKAWPRRQTAAAAR